MIRVLALLLPMATVAMGQQPWTYVHEQSEENTFLTDIKWRGSEILALKQEGQMPWQPPAQGSLLQLAPNGTLLAEQWLAPGMHHVSPTVLIQRTGQQAYLLGTFAEYADSAAGFFVYRMGNNGLEMDSSFYHVYGARKTWLENATILNDSSIVLGGTLTLNTTDPPNLAHFIKLDLNGEVVALNTFGTTGTNIRFTRDIIPYGAGLLTSTERWPSVPGLYTALSSDLNLNSWWNGRSPSNNPNDLVDSVLKGTLSLRPLDDARYMVGGAFKLGSPRYTSAVYVMDTTGTTLQTFIPHSPYTHDYTALLGCLASIDESSFYFLSWENQSLLAPDPPYTPAEPSALHVYKLDNDLHVLCEYVLDGFETNTYYVPNRIKTAPDGGFAIVGARKDMSDPTAKFVGWAQAFGPDACTLGITEQATQPAALVHPNPGRDGFQVTLNGKGVTNGHIQLFDALGNKVAESLMHGAVGNMACSHLPSGLYLYHIVDADGSIRASGRWVKE